MQVILHKTPLLPLAKAPPSFGLTLGDSVDLRADTKGTVTALFWRKGFWLPLIGQRGRLVPIGQLAPEAAELIAPALRQGADLRVRVVEICPAHMSARGQDAICVSVWGDHDRLAQARERDAMFVHTHASEAREPAAS
ncbi:hypothetical protein [Pararhodobacter sp.]|jgi:hypothetical protein|uniref:hypothetical protein n=1 Tax=Pararhodobacter sp. TaxID=2127056 RepID=UPI002FDC7DA0